MQKNILVKQEISLGESENSLSSGEGTLVLLALLEGLSHNVLSSDVWYLSMLSALNIATEKYGVDEGAAKDMLGKALHVARANGKKNSMSSMF